jgi:3-oxoacyl-[acyl-carrier protein] reductase
MSEAFRLDGEVAVVTGAGRPNGIGRAIGNSLLEAGAVVIFGTRTDEDETALRAELEAFHPNAIAMAIDLSNPDSLGSRLEDVAEIGDQYPSILVNNAAVTKDGRTRSAKPNRLNDVMTVNFYGANELVRNFISVHLATESDYARVMNVCSKVGDVGHALQLAYAASKAALANSTKTWAQEFPSMVDEARKEKAKTEAKSQGSDDLLIATPAEIAIPAVYPNVTFNNLVLGYIEGTALTDRIPEEFRPELRARIPGGAGGSPNQVGPVARFIASREARYINGANISVDGGMV